MNKEGLYVRFFKRPMDFIISLLTIIILSPLIVFLAILVKVKLGSPVLFKQNRIGLNEKIFNIYKFRTMSSTKDLNGNLLPDDQRLTKFGKFLRSTSLDELPELLNILKGDMSIVGPRPLVSQYLPFFTDYEKIRHTVRPGLTGNAQVNGRNSIKWEERFRYDIEYANKIKFFSDLSIIVKTGFIVLKRENIGERNQNAAIDFDKYRIMQRGNQNES
ncbi:sugar transferase [Tenericutes bacterium MO-XQ]|jgi:lipopolysaccharide/colanic/teichoic acid biosynthesis glycosyltransferase|nr:sugar transferase [Tenericutes bacterium MO-XQ]